MRNTLRKKGRPPVEDRDPLLAMVELSLAEGHTVAAAAQAGLTIYGLNPEGKYVPVRVLEGETFQRRYREARKPIQDAMRRIEALPKGTRYLGITPPQQPLSYRSEPLKRGARKKSAR